MNQIKPFQWIVIGSGPAGIAAIGKLLDQKISQDTIGWIDPSFSVGDLGKKWHRVPSNTTVALFLRFLHDCHSFRYKECKESFPLNTLTPQDCCHLREIAQPLQWITNHLLSTVTAMREEALSLNLIEGYWHVKTSSSTILAKNVILATGSEPKNLPYSHPPAIPLEIALNPDKLAKEITNQDVVGVFGSSHSAVLALINVIDLQPKMVHNFYRSPHVYAVDLQDWILFDNTGLKGSAAKWARKHLDGQLPANLQRCHVTDKLFEEALALCNKVIYAVGFERRKTPVIEQFPEAPYHETTGIIAPGLFGLGIAYPQAQFDRLGNVEYRVGLWKFMDYLNTILPFWLQYASYPQTTV